MLRFGYLTAEALQQIAKTAVEAACGCADAPHGLHINLNADNRLLAAEVNAVQFELKRNIIILHNPYSMRTDRVHNAVSVNTHREHQFHNVLRQAFQGNGIIRGISSAFIANLLLR